MAYVLSDASGESSGYSYLTLSEIKTYLGEDGSAFDSQLTTIYHSCASQLEQETGQSLKNHDVTYQVDKRDEQGYTVLPFRPFTSLTSVTYTATDESSGTLVEASGHFNTYGSTGRNGEYILEFAKDWNKLDIIYNSDGSTVPDEFKVATLAMIKRIWNDDRDFTGELSKIKMPTYTLQVINSYKRIVI